MRPFTYTGLPARILFGEGVLARLRDEIDALGCRRLLVISTPRQGDTIKSLLTGVEDLLAGYCRDAAMHTPVEVTERALAQFHAVEADGLLAFGGGTAVGLAKALALRTGVPQIAIATTYAGSEVTPVVGQTEAGLKTTLRDPRILPKLVLYDPALTLALPVDASITSGVNAIAHAVEALYAPDANPVSTMMALEGIRAIVAALPAIKAQPLDMAARGGALYGAWLCGTVLGAVGMSLHHKLCHTLGGSFALPHAETHTVLLPHVIAYNSVAAQRQLAPLKSILGNNPASGLQQLAAALGAPTSLRALGLAESDLDRAAELATAKPYPNPRTIEYAPIRALLQSAWAGQDLA